MGAPPEKCSFCMLSYPGKKKKRGIVGNGRIWYNAEPDGRKTGG
jgi:hypothetical protein